MLVTSNFLFFPQCFERVSFPDTSKGVIVWEWVNPFPKQALDFTYLQYKSFENTVGKGEIARNEQFLLSPQCFFFLLKNFLPFSSNLTSILKVLHGNTKSPTGFMYSWRYNVLLEVKGISLPFPSVVFYIYLFEEFSAIFIKF